MLIKVWQHVLHLIPFLAFDADARLFLSVQKVAVLSNIITSYSTKVSGKCSAVKCSAIHACVAAVLYSRS